MNASRQDVAPRPNVMIRTVRTDDAPRLQAFVRGLSPRSRRFRFFSALIELSAAQLQRLIKPDRAGLALVALKEPLQDSAIVAEARYVIDPMACSDAEFAIAVADDFQRQGLGTRLMKLMVVHASRRGVRRLFGEILADNDPMLEFARRSGFQIRSNELDHRTMIAWISLNSTAAAAGR